MKHNYTQTRVIIGFGILLNLIIAYGMLLYKQPFNVDGIIYLNAADAFIKNGIKAAITVYPWPFYSVLIGSLSYVTHLPLEVSALVLNGLITCVLVSSFILLVKELGGGTIEQYFALLIIIIYPYINHDRSNILRDFGYYAFLLTSILFFLRYLKKPNGLYALSWSLTAMTAALFRIEGVVVFVLTPLAIFFIKEWQFKHKITNYLKLNVINVTAVVVAFIFLMFNKNHSVAQLGRLEEILVYLQHGLGILTITYNEKIALLQKYILPLIGKETALLFLVGGLISIFIEVFISTISFSYLIFVTHTFSKKLLPIKHKNQIGLMAYILVTTLILLIFVIFRFFLSSRYVAPLCLLLMLLAPFSLSKLFKEWLTFRTTVQIKRWLFPIASMFLLINVISSFGFFGVSKTYVVDSGYWLQQNTRVNSLIYSNDAQLYYYSHRSGMHYPEDFEKITDWLTQLKTTNLKNYHYVALKISHDEKDKKMAAITFLQTQPIYQLRNKRDDEVFIFKIN